MDKANAICNAVKKRIVPSKKLRRFVEDRAEQIRTLVERECRKARLAAEVRLDGSVAKDTWLRDYADVDVFMRVSPELTKQELREVCLPIAKRALKPYRVIERFAEHPYVETLVEFLGGSLRVNVVPCYNVERGQWLSATDRTPYHTEYVREHIANSQRDEVRLLKAFVRGIGSYGADIKTGGFSGMLCETLVIAYGEFLSVARDFAQWREDRFVDVENYYEGRSPEVHRIFREPLVVIDPVDKGRNLAAAVRVAQLWNFVAATRHFMRKPSSEIFREPKVRRLGKVEYQRLIKTRGLALVCLATGRIDAVVDILWSQLYRTQRALTHFLENHDFNVIRSVAWSDERAVNVLIFELSEERLPKSRRHRGPPISRATESSAFLSKHMGDPATVSGPWIEDGRWVVQKNRTEISARNLLDTKLRDGGETLGVAPLISRAFKKNLRILDHDDLEKLLSANEEFAKFMSTYLSGRPIWLA